MSAIPSERRAMARGAPPPLQASRAALFLDIDGTLLELATTPGSVKVDRYIVTLLPALMRPLSGAMALITGRTLADTDRLFPGLELPVAGQHGLVRRAANGEIHAHPAPPEIGRLRSELTAFAERHPGLRLEDKGSSMALHYRLVPRLASAAHRIVRARVAAAGASWRLQPGKAVVEIVPSGRDKGTAIREYMAEAPFAHRVPVFVGDDRTDEHGFAAVSDIGGFGVKVGRGPTAAAYRLRDVRAVRAWLAASLAAR